VKYIPVFSKPGELRKEGRKGAFHIACPSSGEADVEDNCSSKDCGIDDGNESLDKFNSIARINEDHTVRDVGVKCGVSILSVAATDRVTGNERKGYYNTVQNAEAQATNPCEKEVSSHLMLQNIKIEDSLSESQKEKLSNLLLKYEVHFTKNPGKCNCFEYRFQLQGRVPESRNSRPIPFALSKEVQEQVEEMLADHIIEESYSSNVNPLTLIQRDGKRVRICFDAREANKFMTPDRAKVPPVQMLLQRFHGASCISTLDWSSAFLQIPLEKTSNKWTAFQFQNKVYSTNLHAYHMGSEILSALLLGHFSQYWGADTSEYALHYVDDLVVFSKTFEEHLEHLDSVFRKFTTSGVTMNIGKCNFCKPEIKF